jgi:hypothetical protein
MYQNSQVDPMPQGKTEKKTWQIFVGSNRQHIISEV